ncbi:MAG: hypothetical protein MSG64_15045 [Pyrinomonadaceae bacterium MAG19_C2-C3]|nr:hypothetical protein [Pyrinomonadaceae bacterium MAG19_C2-C3]
MFSKKIFSILGFVTLGCVALLLTGNTTKVLPSQSLSATVSPTQWEYCAVTNFYSTESDLTNDKKKTIVGVATVSYFEENGLREEGLSIDSKIEKSTGYNSYAQAKRLVLARALAVLGNQGWELISEMSYPKLYDPESEPSFYFKRRKTEIK